MGYETSVDWKSLLQNAHWVRSRMLNIIGDHATYHLKYDVQSKTDIKAIAAQFSHWVGTCENSEEVGERVASAIAPDIQKLSKR